MNNIKNVPAIRFKGCYDENGNWIAFTHPWEQRKVGEFLTESRESGHKGDVAHKMTVKLWGKGVYKKNDAGSANTQYFIRHAGQFIYSKLDFLNCAFGVVPEELESLETTADVPAFDCDGVNPYFMFYTAIQPSFYEKNGMIADGSRKAKRIHADTFLDMPFIVPSLEEQNKIVNLLNELDDLLTLHQRKCDIYKKLKKGVMQKLFSHEVRFRADDGSEFPDWEKKKLGNCCSIKTGKLDASAAKENGRYKFFTCAREDSSIDTYSFEGVAILIAGNGDVGHTKIYDGKFDAYQRTYVLQNFTENPYYLKAVIDMNLPRKIISELQSGAMPYIKLGTLSDLIVLCPSSKDEQQKIAKCLSSFDNVIENQKAKVAVLKKLKKCMLQKMFV